MGKGDNPKFKTINSGQDFDFDRVEDYKGDFFKLRTEILAYENGYSKITEIKTISIIL